VRQLLFKKSWLPVLLSWCIQWKSNFSALESPDNMNQKSFLSAVEHCYFTPISRTLRFFEPIFVSLTGSKNRYTTVVNRGGMVIADKDAKIYVPRPYTIFYITLLHRAWITNQSFSIGLFSVSGKQQLSFVHGQGQKSEQTNGKGFHDNLPSI